MFIGDFNPGATIHSMFTTIDTDGVPIVLTGSPAIAVYKAASDTQSTSGVSISASVDSVVGLNRIAIDLSSDGTFYAAGSVFHVVLTAGTVDGVSVVGYVVARFTIGFSSAYARLGAPAGASVSADVAAIKSDTAAILVDTGTTLDGRIPAALVGGRMDSSVGAMAANVLTASAIADNAIDAAAIAADVAAEISGGTNPVVIASGTAQAGGPSTITAAAASTSVDDQWELNGIVLTGGTGAGQSRQILSGVTATEVMTVNEPWAIVPDATTTYAIFGFGILAATLTDVANAVWDKPVSENQVAGSRGEKLPANMIEISGDAAAADAAEAVFDGTVTALPNVTIGTVTALTGHTGQTGDAFARLGAPAGASVSADIAAVKAETAAIVADTNELQTDWANGGRLDLLIDGVATAAALATVGTNVSTVITNLAIVDGIVDTIVAKTNSLTFTVAGQVDANSLRFNSQLIGGGGATPWTRA